MCGVGQIGMTDSGIFWGGGVGVKIPFSQKQKQTAIYVRDRWLDGNNSASSI